ncbi:predicted protein [Naegleria gruberi]|uniref:Predicted protein n=1 Tax=Naegleria gruberi TaxID=5762 RepID=D2W418_NAEGR|nr:uncharacterized protein NAEGRDRAFT_82290 [Naegleria gruberi]EFC36182.1 predicted protein [Naegleria gruberi]|eukprot:XP_002668926.1 predicted protein [Naegleria gruberi strain NEG-M]
MSQQANSPLTVPLRFKGDKVVIITGASDGIGKAAVTHLVEMGAHVILACRSEDKAMKVMEEIRNKTANKDAMMQFIPLDLSDLESVRNFARKFLEKNLPIHALVCNAGVWEVERKKTKQQFENTYGINHLGHFLLVNLLLDKLKESAPSRIIILSSKIHSSGDAKELLSDPNYEKPSSYSGKQTYANSKLANLLFAYKLVRNLNEGSSIPQSGVSVIAMHPGVVNTQIFAGLLGSFSSIIGGLFFDTPEHASLSVVFHAVHPDQNGVTGFKYYEQWKEKKSIADSFNEKYQDDLWEMSVKHVGGLTL